MTGTGDFKVAVKLHADASQYTAEFTKAGQLAQTFAGTLQSSGSLAASGLQAATTASQALGATTLSSSQQASAGLSQASTAAQNLGSNLQATGTQASQASQGMDGLTQSSREATQSQQQSRAAGDALIAMLRDQIATTGKSADELLRYRAAQSGVAAEAAPLILQWQNQKAAQLAAAEAARQEEAAQREAQAAKQRATQAQEQFLAGLREQVALQGKSSTEVLQYRAAQLGVSAEAANSIRLIDEANQKGAISAGQHAQAMRMLPAQMTDVVTSVASGMPIWMVAIQQGGQIKDSFGGAGNAARSMLGAITPLTAGLAAGTTVIGLTAAAYYQGSAEVDGFRKALVMTGNTAGVTVSQMSEIAKAVGNVVGGQHAASQALTQLAGTGAIAGESLQQFTTVAMNLERYAGQPIKKTAEDLAKLGDEPVKASIQLNEQYHYLTESVYRQIKALDDQGRKDDAAALAQKTYADAMAERADTMSSKLGTLERAWESLGSMASKTWNAMLNVGRTATLDDIRTKIDATNRELNALLSGDGFTSNGGGAAFGAGARGRVARIEQLKKQLGDLNAQAAPLEAEDAQAQIKAQQQADEEIKLAARQRTDALAKEVRSRAEIRKQEIEQLDRDRKTLDLSQQEYDQLLAGINAKYKDPKDKKGAGGISVTDTDLANMRSQLLAAQQYHQQLVALGSGATELNSAERESLKISEQLLLATDGKTIARLKEKQAIADTLAAQLRSNEGLEQSYKAHQKLIDTTNQDAVALEQRAREQEAANAVFGKGRTAIEQMTLATLAHQMAEAQSSDSFDPKYIAALERKISAQKRFVDALGKADYKAVTAHADELLRNAQELSRTYEDELALSGLTSLEREKIVAQRAVELKYAKELAKLDQQSLQDDERDAARQKIEQARDIESAAVVAKAQQSHMAKASDEISRNLTDALMRGFDAGKDMAENLADTTVNLFKTMVLRPTISAVMTPVSVAINGVVQQGLSAVGIGGGPSGSLGASMPGGSLTDWSKLGSNAGDWLMTQSTSLGLNGWSSMSDAAYNLGNTIKGVDTWLKDIPGFSGGIGSAAGYLGAIHSLSQGQYGSAIGSAIGTYILPGIGTMIGSTLGGLVDGLFAGDSGTSHYGAGAIYKGGAVTDGADIYNRATFGMGAAGEWSSSNQAAISGIAGTLGASLDGFAKAFGKEAGYTVATAFADDSSGDGAWGSLRITDALGNVLADWEQSRSSKWAPKTFADGEEGYKQYLAAAAVDVKSAMLAMDLPGWADQLLSAATDLDTLNAALGQIAATKAVFDSLGKSMDMFAGISEELQTQLLAGFGGIEALSASAGGFYAGFYSEAERIGSLADNLRDTLAGLDISIDPAMGETAKQQYRDAVQAAMDAGQGELAVKLMGMSASFAQVADALGKTMSDLLSERRTLSAEYLRASGDAESYAEALRAIATESYTDAERAAWDYNAALQKQIEALDEAAQLQQSLAEITGQTAQSVQGVLQDLLGRVQATSAFRVSLGQSIESARLGTMDLSGKAGYLSSKESGLWSQLGSAADPVAVAEQLQQTILDRISAESLLREQLDGQTLGALQQQLSVAQSLQSAAQSMQSTVDGLRLGNTSALNPYAQLQYAGGKFDDAYARALAGDLGAWKDVQSFGQSYVGLGRGVFASSTDSADIFFKVTEAMDQLAAMGMDADPQVTALNTQIELLQTVGQNTEQQTWVSEQQLQAFEQLDSVLQRQQLQQQQQADKQLALAQQQIDELRKHNALLQAQITQQAQISAEQKQRDAKLISAAEKSADAARMAEAQA